MRGSFRYRRRPARGPFRCHAPAALTGLLAVSCLLLFGYGGQAAVSVFPIPGSRVAPPQSQIVLRGVAPEDVGRVLVTGSRTGVHGGRLAPDSDGQGPR
jgi:hypothetical protein